MAPVFKCDYLVISISAFSEINRKLYYEMAELGKKVVVVFPEYLKFDSGKQKYEPVTSDKIVTIPAETVFDNPRITYFRNIGSIIKKYKPRYIYTEYDPASLMGVVLGYLSRRYGARLLCNSCENLEIGLTHVYKREGYRGLGPAIMKNIFSMLAKPNVHHVFALSKDGERIFRDMNFKNVSINHLGFDEELFRPDAAKREIVRNQLGLNGPVIAYFGRLIHAKGIHILIQALSMIRDEKWTFLIDEFGRYKNPYQEALLQKIKEYGIADRVVFFDAPHEKVSDYMNAADIVVVPSISSKKWKEQFGRVAPEAMACGKAVIVSDSGALKELVPGSGHVIPEQDPQALADFLKKLLNDQEQLQALCDAGLKRSAVFTIRQQAINLLAIE
jgi:glycosyltransferase involved in cell wall biosynthesis